jgi:hypothetical protein
MIQPVVQRYIAELSGSYDYLVPLLQIILQDMSPKKYKEVLLSGICKWVVKCDDDDVSLVGEKSKKQK